MTYKCSGIKSLNIPSHFAPATEFRKSSQRSSGVETVCKKHKLEYNQAYLRKTISIKHRDNSIVGRFLEALDVSRQDALLVLKQESISTDTGCWEWQHSTSNGYGAFRIARKLSTEVPNFQAVHKWAHWLATGQVDSGTIHHKCANRVCFNPEHLEQITLSANIGEMLARKEFVNRIKELEQQVAVLESKVTTLEAEIAHRR